VNNLEDKGKKEIAEMDKKIGESKNNRNYVGEDR